MGRFIGTARFPARPEAKHFYKAGELLYPEDEYRTEAEATQMESMEQDDRIGLVEGYLEMLLPRNWGEMDLFNRRSFISTKDDPLMPKGTERREFVSNAEIWAECFGKPLGELRSSDSYAISGIMGRISGWNKTKDRKRIPIYGQQRVYHRDREK